MLRAFDPKLEFTSLLITRMPELVRIVLHGSKKPALLEEACEIFAIGMNNQIRLEPEEKKMSLLIT